jgi:hypothetical protein
MGRRNLHNRHVQSWIAIIGTAVGAVIGLGSAFLTDRAKWKREQIQDRLGVRRELYSGYIAALTEIHELMRAVSRDRQLPARDRAKVIHEVFHAGGRACAGRPGPRRMGSSWPAGGGLQARSSGGESVTS